MSKKSPAPSSASPSAAAANRNFQPSLPPPASLIPGAGLHVVTRHGGEFDGTLFCYDSSADLLVVELSYGFDSPLTYHDRPPENPQSAAAEAAVKGEGKKDFTMLNAKHVRVELSTPGPSKSRTLPPLSIPSITSKIDANVAARVSEMESIGIGVALETQRLFDAINKTTPVKWAKDFSSFIVMETVRVSHPFTSSSCQSIAVVPTGSGPAANKKAQQAAASAENMLKRVQKIIDAERARLKI